MSRRLPVLIIVSGCVVFILIQFFPVRKTNPPVAAAISLPDDVAGIFKRSCYDCHSNETKWPWYSNVAPVSWLIARDVNEGREHLNFSDWGNLSTHQQKKKKSKIHRELSKDEMPPFIYKMGHPDATVSDAEKETIYKWAAAQ